MTLDSCRKYPNVNKMVMCMMNKEKTTVIIIIHLSILPEETFPL